MLISKSPISGKDYSIPEVVDDRGALDSFLERNPGKKIVVVQGLGFVGAVMALVVANAHGADYAVIGVDLPSVNSFWKVKDMNGGYFPVTSSDEDIDKLFRASQQNGNLCATCDEYAYCLADIIVVDINLDVQKGHGGDGSSALNDAPFQVDLGPFTAAIESLASRCKSDVTVLVESTVPPGTCGKVVRPILERKLAERNVPKDYKLGHSYERVMPGPNYVNSIRNYYRVYSGMDDKSADSVRSFLETIVYSGDYPLTRLSNTTATEMAKVLENSYRAMNIGFVQEWTEFAESAGVNLYEVIEAIRLRSTHSNLMRPGLGVGGYCLTKDPLLASWSATQLFGSRPLEQSEAAVHINDSMPLHTFDVVKRLFEGNLSGKSALLLGVSYLNDVADTRFTPVALLYDELRCEGVTVTLHDPLVKYWEERGVAVQNEIDDVLSDKYDLVIICTAHSEYRQSDKLRDYLARCRGTRVVDAWGLLDQETVEEVANHNVIRIIGRGDI